MSVKKKILQWNVRGFKNEIKNELEILLKNENLGIICLQETKTRVAPKFKDFQIFFKNTRAESVAKGGVMTAIESHIYAEEIPLNTNICAVAVRVAWPEEFVICNVYQPPKTQHRKREWGHLLNQLGEKFLILGDFNSKSILWGAQNACNKGKILEELIDERDLIVLNDGNPTFFSFATKTETHIDVTLKTNNFENSMNWKIKKDPLSSDHYPIIIEIDKKMDTKMRPKWKLKEAKWGKFYDELKISCKTVNEENLMEINELEQKIVNLVIGAAEKSIPKTTGNKSSRFVPWWTKEIGKSIKEKSELFKKYKKTKNIRDLIIYTEFRKKVNNEIKKLKKASWEKFLKDMDKGNCNMWKKFNLLRGKFRNNGINSVKIENRLITDRKEITEKLALKFKEITDIKKYNKKTQELIQNEKNFEIPEDNQEVYNLDITINEIKKAIQHCKGTSPGPDEISYEMLKKAPIELIEKILLLFNRILREKQIPRNWKKTFSIPIPKPKKDPKIPENLRTIQLSSCLCKTMEKIINKRLVWWLEKEKVLNKNQSGFRKGRSTTDVLARIDDFTKKAWMEKQKVLLVSFDLEKAYDRTLRGRTLEILKEKGLKGNILHFLFNLIMERETITMIGNTTSRPQKIDTGLTQGSIISVTLFLVAVDVLMQNNDENVEKLMFADDLVVMVKGKCNKKIIKCMQQEINQTEISATKMGCKISVEKTKAIVLSREKDVFWKKKLKCCNKKLEYVKFHKVLGLVIDNKLNYNKHILQIKKDTNKLLPLIQMICNQNYGLKFENAIKLHESLIVSRLDYASEIYGNASKTNLQKLNQVHNAGLRIASGIFRTTPIDFLLAETGYLPLEERRKIKLTNFAIKTMQDLGNPNRPTMICENTKTHPTKTTSFGKAAEILKKLQINLKIKADTKINTEPEWNERHKIDIELSENIKKDMDIETMKQLSLEKINKYKNFHHVYTDGSKNDFGTGWGVVSGEIEKWGKMIEGTTIFNAEAYAISQAINLTREISEDQIAIFSDSLSVLTAIQNNKDNVIVRKVSRKLRESGKVIWLVWIPSHTGLEGNEKADLAAKKGTETPSNPKNVGEKSNVISLVKEKIWDQWAEKQKENLVFNLRGSLKKNKELKGVPRRTAMVFMRIRCGHTRITMAHKFNGETAQKCRCGETITTNHILSCQSGRNIRQKLKIDPLTILIGDDKDNILKLAKYLKVMKFFDEI
jgi:exonuclease III/ribonuclease HI